MVQSSEDRVFAPEELVDFVEGDSEGACMICNGPTRYLELNFEGPLHPGACNDAMWAEYVEALRKAPS